MNIKESETVKTFRIRRREPLKGAIESGCLSMIANILEAFDLSKKEWAK